MFACATVAGAYPFKKLININADSASYIAQADCQPQFQFKITFYNSSYVNNVGSYQSWTMINKKYKIPAPKYISSVYIHQWGVVDDCMDIYLNNSLLSRLSIPYCGVHIQWIQTQGYLNTNQLEALKQSLINNHSLEVKGILSDWCGENIALEGYGLEITISYE